MKFTDNSNILLLLLTLYTGAPIFSANIIFDLGGVLIMPDKSTIAMKAGLLRLGFYALAHGENPRTAFFDILDGIDPYTDTEIRTFDETGAPLPSLMCDWLKGIPSKKVLEKIEKEITKTHSLWPLATALFEPQFMASAQHLIPSGKKFVQECIEQGHCVYILSNWDAESFTYLQKQYPEFFDLFSGIVISGDCGLLKPDPAIFKYLLLEYKLDPKNCFFIDNQVENVTAASIVGISGSLIGKGRWGAPNFKKTGKDLTSWIKKQLQYAPALA